MILENPVATGNTASIYLHDGKIIKSFNDYLPKTEAEYEANKQRYAYAHGLPVPYVFEVTEINGKQAIIMEYVPGQTMGKTVLGDMAKAEQYIGVSVDIQLKIHDVRADNFELMTDKLNRQLLSVSVLSGRQKNFLLEKLMNMQYEKRLCHGDFHVFNLIMNQTGVTVIDWVDASAGDIKADVYRTYLLYSQNSMELANLYLRIYCEKSGLFQDDIFAWEPIIAGAKLSENVTSEKAGRLLEIVGRYCPL
ncbi:MAG: aminoglycoside phosphotransferase family protein [Oscillospiraceae bacterium]|jgi:aminoglycoside phosphotransferase (APT) family kinase protein|nr:aminoglycoside phosphotransferase family protein [Oscillospiraceae bacterium]